MAWKPQGLVPIRDAVVRLAERLHPEEARENLIQALGDGKVSAEFLSTDGRQVTLQAEFWRGAHATEVVRSGEAQLVADPRDLTAWRSLVFGEVWIPEAELDLLSAAVDPEAGATPDTSPSIEGKSVSDRALEDWYRQYRLDLGNSLPTERQDIDAASEHFGPLRTVSQKRIRDLRKGYPKRARGQRILKSSG